MREKIIIQEVFDYRFINPKFHMSPKLFLYLEKISAHSNSYLLLGFK